MPEPTRDDLGRFASKEKAAPRSRFGSGTITKSRSPFGDGTVLSPGLDDDRSRFGMGAVRYGDATSIRTHTAKIIRIPEVNRPGANRE